MEVTYEYIKEIMNTVAELNSQIDTIKKIMDNNYLHTMPIETVHQWLIEKRDKLDREIKEYIKNYGRD